MAERLRLILMLGILSVGGMSPTSRVFQVLNRGPEGEPDAAVALCTCPSAPRIALLPA